MSFYIIGSASDESERGSMHWLSMYVCFDNGLYIGFQVSPVHTHRQHVSESINTIFRDI